MDALGKEELLSFFNRRLKRFGDRPEALRWTPEGQRLRYETLLDIAGDITSREILDFGCGAGGLHGFIKEQGLDVDYCGIDINEDLIRLAREKYPETEFHCLDLEESEFNRPFDLVFICGVFNLRVFGVEESMQSLLKRLFTLCRDAIHLNALSDYSPHNDVDLYYLKPEEILRFALKELSQTVILRHGIVKSDIFLSVYKSENRAA